MLLSSTLRFSGILGQSGDSGATDQGCDGSPGASGHVLHDHGTPLLLGRSAHPTVTPRVTVGSIHGCQSRPLPHHAGRCPRPSHAACVQHVARRPETLSSLVGTPSYAPDSRGWSV